MTRHRNLIWGFVSNNVQGRMSSEDGLYIYWAINSFQVSFVHCIGSLYVLFYYDTYALVLSGCATSKMTLPTPPDMVSTSFTSTSEP